MKRVKVRIFPKLLIFLLPFMLLASALFFLKKREAPSNQPQNQQPQKIVTPALTPEQTILKLEAMLEKKPSDVTLLFELANAYAQQQNIPQAYLYFKKIVELAPKSPQGLQASQWIARQEDEAQQSWRLNLGKRFQDISQMGYENMTIQLAAIARKVEQKQQAVAQEIEKVEEESGTEKAEAAAKATEEKKAEEAQQPGLYILTPVTSTPASK